MKKLKIPAIYKFHDYRKYLEEVFASLKAQKISKRTFAKENGVSNAYLTMVLNKKRNLDPRYIEAFGEYLNLSASEKKYFENLVLLSDSEDSDERANAFKKLSRFKTYQTNKTADVITHKYLEHWYHVAIREMSFLDDFQKDAEWIQARLQTHLTISEIKKALDFLEKNNLLKEHQNEHFDCSEGIYKLALGNFHKQMLHQVAESIENVDRTKRQIVGFSKSMSRKNFEKAAKIMEKAITEISELEADSKNKELYHFYFTGIPLTNKGE